MQNLIQFALALGSTASELSVGEDLRKTYLPTPRHATNASSQPVITRQELESALETLNLNDSRHVVVLLGALAVYARSHADADNQAFLVKTLETLVGTMGLNTPATQASAAYLRIIGEALRKYIVRDTQSTQRCVGILKRFINLLTDNREDKVRVLTPQHAQVMEALVLTRQYDKALAFITQFTQVLQVNPPATGSDVLDHVIFWYLSGQVFACHRDFERARNCYRICFTTKAYYASAITIAAVIKFVFCNMLLREHGINGSPREAPAPVIAALDTENYKYFQDIVEAYNKGDINEFKSCIVAREEPLKRNKMFGLAKQIVPAMQMRAVQELPNVYIRVPMDQVLIVTKLESEEAAKRMLSDMIASGIIDAQLEVTEDGKHTVRFGARASSSDAGTRLQSIMTRYTEALRDISKLQAILHDVSIDAAVKREVMKQKASNPRKAANSDLQAALAKSRVET